MRHYKIGVTIATVLAVVFFLLAAFNSRYEFVDAPNWIFTVTGFAYLLVRAVFKAWLEDAIETEGVPDEESKNDTVEQAVVWFDEEETFHMIMPTQFWEVDEELRPASSDSKTPFGEAIYSVIIGYCGKESEFNRRNAAPRKLLIAMRESHFIACKSGEIPVTIQPDPRQLISLMRPQTVMYGYSQDEIYVAAPGESMPFPEEFDLGVEYVDWGEPNNTVTNYDDDDDYCEN